MAWTKEADGHLAEVRQRPLWSSTLALLLGQLIRKLHDEAAVALLLVGREDQDAGQVVVLHRVLLFRKVAHDVVNPAVQNIVKACTRCVLVKIGVLPVHILASPKI